jgi:cytochrome c551/c552
LVVQIAGRVDVVEKQLAVAAALAILLFGCSKKDAGPPRPDINPNLALQTMLVDHACSNCHAVDYTRVGPSMKDVASVLSPPTPEVRARLRKAILEGTKGNYGFAIMPPQKQVTPADADKLVDAILGAGNSPPKR